MSFRANERFEMHTHRLLLACDARRNLHSLTSSFRDRGVFMNKETKIECVVMVYHVNNQAKISPVF